MKMPPADATPAGRITVLLVLLSGIAFSVAGPALTLFRQVKATEDQALKVPTPEEEIENLRTNKKVTRLVRLIAYDPAKDPDLAVGKLSSLGRSSQRYTFATDYDALRGRVVSEAVQMSGLHLTSAYRVTAVIFPVENDRMLYPVNARGLLQVIQAVEESGPATKKFDVSSRVTAAGFSNLQIKRPISSWAWDNYKSYYPEFCDAAHAFRCSKENYDASNQIGDLSEDWHPLGFARNSQPDTPPCRRRAADVCTGADWAQLKAAILPDFGARVFLTENAELSSLPGRMVIDFDHPTTQRMPILPP